MRRLLSGVFLLQSVGGWAATAEFRPSCVDYLKAHFAVSYFEVGPKWKSDTLLPATDWLNSDRVRWLADQIYAETNGHLWREAQRELLPRIQEDDSWVADFERSREYFNYGPTFQAFSEWMDGVLPEQGPILHVGGGTGMLAGLLAFRQPERRMVIAEGPWGEVVGLPRLRAILSPESVPNFLNRHFGAFALRQGFYSGIYTAFSYFNLQPSLQESFFATVAAGLVSGGRLAMIEPIHGREHLRRDWFLSQVVEGAEAGAPHGEHDLAFHSFIFLGAVGRASMGSKPPEVRFANVDQLKQRAHAAGLELIVQEHTHDGISMRFLFQKIK